MQRGSSTGSGDLVRSEIASPAVMNKQPISDKPRSPFSTTGRDPKFIYMTCCAATIVGFLPVYFDLLLLSVLELNCIELQGNSSTEI